MVLFELLKLLAFGGEEIGILLEEEGVFDLLFFVAVGVVLLLFDLVELFSFIGEEMDSTIGFPN